GVSVTACANDPTQTDIAIAGSDGKIRLGTIQVETQFLDIEHASSELQNLAPGDVVPVENGVAEMTPQGQLRKQSLAVHLTNEIPFESASLQHLDAVFEDRKITLAAVTSEGNVLAGEFRRRKNVITRKETLSGKLDNIAVPNKHANQAWLSGRADQLHVICQDGTLQRMDISNEPTLIESVDLVAHSAGATVTSVKPIIGRETLMVGDSSGKLTAWFRVRNAAAETDDGAWLLPIHSLPSGNSAVTSLGTSQRSRMLAAGYGDGSIRLFHVTSAKLLTQARALSSEPIRNLVIGPKDDGLFAVGSNQTWLSEFDPAYPEATFNALFRPVWYEGREHPDLIWQSSSGGVQAEMKLSLRPLIFGTIKATVYAMLFGAPIAVLAAIYTSEFLNTRWRTSVKSLIETMASLPSVVLGFLGGLVIAPLVEDVVPETLCAFFTIPFAFLLFSFFWQMLPHRVLLRISGWRIPMAFVALAVGVWAASLLGPIVELRLFADDIVLWLDGQKGSGTGAWMFLLLPLCGLCVSLAITRWFNPLWIQMSANWSRSRFVALNLVKFLIGSLAAVVLALTVSYLLSQLGWDPRGSFVDTYVQRNAMVVGFVMGFAIIPIIYTISEDALSTVPRHLRSASLGAGATQWQTAVRVVIPTAMSGLFSAMMIGLGRAVGETMIVLMAAGNTPVMEWNIFNGFRTLSANIAVELPEAPRDTTHFRTLFLAALTLLVMTFIVNTIAEFVRLRFRKRAVQL
ncbi:MAG: ABC transporter permease subunit, partial [Planctomycetales bacterium]|nr:ABC transporter permease subunit [Planctomycetales bacterium]